MFLLNFLSILFFFVSFSLSLLRFFILFVLSFRYYFFHGKSAYILKYRFPKTGKKEYISCTRFNSISSK